MLVINFNKLKGDKGMSVQTVRIKRHEKDVDNYVGISLNGYLTTVKESQLQQIRAAIDEFLQDPTKDVNKSNCSVFECDF